MNKNNRSLLRKQLRAARRSLNPAQQRLAGRQLMCRLRNWLPLVRSRHIAFYLPNDGEIDPTPLLRCMEQRGKCCYLPRLFADGQNRVWFLRYRSGDKLYKNRFGIPEPSIHQPAMPAWALQTVLMPLVGFDRKGNRLGMGGGFYDRSFAFKRTLGKARPLLLGLAHGLQEVDDLPFAEWDVPVDGIATDKERLYFR